MKHPFTPQNGFSLIEVLVTLLLISIGIIGLVAMQGRAIQYTQDSVQRNQAAMLTSDLFELIKANPSEISSYSFDSLPPAATDPTSCIELANSAVSQQLACWSRDVRALLPGAKDEEVAGEFHVCRSKAPGSCANGSVVEIQVAWQAQGEGCLNDADLDGGEDGEEEEPSSSLCHYRIRSEL